MFVIVQVKGVDVLDPTLIGVSPSTGIKVIGSFDRAELATKWVDEYLAPLSSEEEKFIVLPIEWYGETTY